MRGSAEYQNCKSGLLTFWSYGPQTKEWGKQELS